jgi:uncharacterized membrane protein YhaH (DUF805 family)
MNWFISALKKYATFSGRAQRSEYWYFFLFCVLINILLAVVDSSTGTVNPKEQYGLLSGLFGLAMLLPGLAVGVRRLHDTDRNGWWLLLMLVPVIGTIVLLVFFSQDSQPTENRFGANPKTA